MSDPFLHLSSITATSILREVLRKKKKKRGWLSLARKRFARKRAAAVICNLAAERKSVPQVHMPVSLISTMGTTRHQLFQRWKSSEIIGRPPSRAPFLSFSDVNNAYPPLPRTPHGRPPGAAARARNICVIYKYEHGVKGVKRCCVTRMPADTRAAWLR